MAQYTKNLTSGSELKSILLFTLPLLAGNLFQQLYNIVDSAIVGQFLGYNPLAAVGATGSLTFLFYSLCNGLSTGAGVLISQAFGAGRHDECKKYIANSAYAVFIIGLIITVVSVLLTEPMLRLLDTPETIIEDSIVYMQISCGGTVAVAAYNWINAALRSIGDSKTPLYFLAAASVINIVLDLLFIIVFEWGVAGAALATIIAQAVSAIGCIIFAVITNKYFRLERKHLTFDPQKFIKSIKTGAPIALQNAMIAASMIFLQRIANLFDDIVIAAYTATMRIEQLIQQPFSSLGVAVSTFTGQNVGAGNSDRVLNGYKQGMKLMLIFAAVIMAVFLVFSNNIIAVFISEQAVCDIGGAALVLSCLFYPFLGTIHVTRGLLNGAGDVGYAMFNGLIEVVGRICFALVLINIPSVGWWAIWGTTCLTWLLTALISLLRYRNGKWRRRCLVE